MLLSTLSFAFMNIAVKYLVHYPTFQIVFFRAIGSLLITFSYLRYKNINPWGNQRKLLMLRGLVGVTSMVLFFWGVHYISVGTAVTLRYLSPIFAAIFTVLFFKGKIKAVQWFFFSLSFTGVVFIKGLDAAVSGFGVGLVLGAAVFSALVYLLIQKIGKQDHPVVVVHYFMIITTLVGGVGSLFSWEKPQLWDWGILFSLGIFGYFGQLFMTKAFQNAAAYRVAPFKYVEVLFTLFFSFFILVEPYSKYQLIGAFLVILGLVLNGLYKSKTKS